MKKIIILSLLMIMPLIVNAEVTEKTPVHSPRSDISEINSTISQNGSIIDATNGYYIEGLKITCNSSNKIDVTIMNAELESTLTCANGNKNPYREVIANGLNNSELQPGKECSSNEDEKLMYASRLYNYDCNFIGTSSENKTAYNTNTTTKDDVATTTTTTAKVTGTTDNKTTGVEDYFIVLGIIGIVVTFMLYVIDRKNVFKKI